MTMSSKFDRSDFYRALAEVVDLAAMRASSIEVEQTVKALIRDHPASGVSEGEARQALSQMAVDKRVPIAFG